jgi:hypothetical protein
MILFVLKLKQLMNTPGVMSEQQEMEIMIVMSSWTTNQL